MPTIIATNSITLRANALTTGITITHGFTLVNDDVLYAFLAQGDETGTGWESSSGGTWTELADQETSVGPDRASGVLRRVVTDAGSEPSDYVFTRDNDGTDILGVIVVQVRGADTSTPEDATTTANDGTGDFTPANVTITTNTDNALVLIYHAAFVDFVGQDYSGKSGGAPSTFNLEDEDLFDNDTHVSQIFIELASKTQASKGLVTPGDWTCTANEANSAYSTYAVAIKPAAVVSLVDDILYVNEVLFYAP